LLKLTIDNIKTMSEHQQISDSVEQVAEEIKEYNKEKDLGFLKELKDICIQENMTVEIGKMYRNISMYHFYANDLSKAVISMQLAVDLLRRENCDSLLAVYYSELGLIYFYNREYLYTKTYYDEAEELISKSTDISKHNIFLHYYRYGLLLSNMHKYELAGEKLEKASTFSDDEKYTALVTMNLGIVYKRQKDFKAALKYYSKALYILGDRDMSIKSAICNNIAEVYKILGQYKKALVYMDKAFKCITDDDLSLHFIYFNTFTEIKLLMGDRESVLDEFLALLTRVEDYHINKEFIIEGISDMIEVGCEHSNMLKRLEAAIEELIEFNTYDNEDYVKGLKGCIRDIRQCLKELAN